MAEVEEDRTSENQKESPYVRNIMCTIKPAILMEYCCGIFRFSVHDKTLLPPKGKMKAYSAVASCIVTVLYSLYIIFADKTSFMHKLNIVRLLFIAAQYAIFVLITFSHHSQANIRIFSLFAELDKMLNIDSIKSMYTSSRAHTVIYLVVLITTHIAMTSYYLLITNKISGEVVITLQMYFIPKLEILMMCIIIGLVKRRLCVINEYIKKFNDENDKSNDSVFVITQSRYTPNNISFNWIGRPSDENVKIHDLALAYDHAGTICGLINDVFNFQMLMTLATTFESMITTIWNLLHAYLSGENDIGFILNVILGSIMSLMNILVMAFVCETLLRAREETKILVNGTIMNYDLPKIMRNQAKALMQLIDALLKFQFMTCLLWI